MCRVIAVVPCHNRREKTLRFIQAFLKQTEYRSGYSQLSLVLVDAASQDGTIAAVQSPDLQEQFRRHQIDFHLLQVPAHYYWSATTNVGVRFALQQSADYVLTINDDCMIEPDYLDRLVRTARQYQLPVLGSRIDYLPAPGLVWALGIETDWKGHLFALNDRNQWFSTLPLQKQEAPWLPTAVLAGDGVLIQRQVFESIGLYAEKVLPHYLADVEWTLRAGRAGFQVAVCPQAIVYDDSPLPNEESAQPPMSRSELWQALKFRYGHPRSGENLLAKLYVIQHYCPLRWKPWAFLRRGLAIVNWVRQRPRSSQALPALDPPKAMTSSSSKH